MKKNKDRTPVWDVWAVLGSGNQIAVGQGYHNEDGSIDVVLDTYPATGQLKLVKLAGQ